MALLTNTSTTISLSTQPSTINEAILKQKRKLSKGHFSTENKLEEKLQTEYRRYHYHMINKHLRDADHNPTS